MKDVDNLIRNSVHEYGTNVVQERYKKHAVAGMWESEKILVEKYFPRDSSVLDLACGSGRVTLPMHRLGYKMTGVDLTPEMIEIAKNTAEIENSDISYKVGDATQLDFGDTSFDNSILSNNGLASIPGEHNRLKVLQEIKRILKPGGHIILSIPIRSYKKPYLSYWIKTWVEYFILSYFGYKTKGANFGDFFYHRNNNGVKMKQVQFLHFFSKREIEILLTQSKLMIVEKSRMSEISENDTLSMRGSLSEKDDIRKRQVFYICKKM